MEPSRTRDTDVAVTGIAGRAPRVTRCTVDDSAGFPAPPPSDCSTAATVRARSPSSWPRATAPATAAELRGELVARAAFRSSTCSAPLPDDLRRRRPGRVTTSIMIAKAIAAIALTAGTAGSIALATTASPADSPARTTSQSAADDVASFPRCSPPRPPELRPLTLTGPPAQPRATSPVDPAAPDPQPARHPSRRPRTHPASVARRRTTRPATIRTKPTRMHRLDTPADADAPADAGAATVDRRARPPFAGQTREADGQARGAGRAADGNDARTRPRTSQNPVRRSVRSLPIPTSTTQISGASPGRLKLCPIPPAGRQEQVLPVRARSPGSAVVPPGERGEVVVERGDLLGVARDVAVRGDRRTVDGLPEVPPRLGSRVAADGHGLPRATTSETRSPNRARTWSRVAPQRRGLRAGRGRRRVRLHRRGTAPR